MTKEEREKMLIEIHKATHLNSKLLDRHDKSLYGNGQPGICTRLKELEMSTKLNSKWAVGIVAAVASLLGGGITITIGKLVEKLI